MKIKHFRPLEMPCIFPFRRVCADWFKWSQGVNLQVRNDMYEVYFLRYSLPVSKFKTVTYQYFLSYSAYVQLNTWNSETLNSRFAYLLRKELLDGIATTLPRSYSSQIKLIPDQIHPRSNSSRHNSSQVIFIPDQTHPATTHPRSYSSQIKLIPDQIHPRSNSSQIKLIPAHIHPSHP